MRTRAWRFAPVLIVASLLSLGIPAPAADGLPDADTIHAKIAAASGALPATFRETAETVTSSGSTTVEHRFRRGKDFRTTNDTGRFHTERGSFNGQSWHMNDNGQVVLEQPDPGRAARERIATTVTPIAAPVAGYLISALNAQGYGAKEYVDAAAWRVVRRDVIGVNGTVTTTYDDVRPDHGRVFAHHAHIDNGYSQISGDMRIVEYVPGDFPASEIAIPRPRRALVTFPPGVTSVDLPAKFGRSHVYVRVNVGGRGLDFVLDSGAAGITIDSTVARELGLAEYDKRSTVTAGRFTTARTVIPEMRIGPLVMRDVAVQEVPHGWQTAPDVKEVGLLGFDFLSELGVTIDYEHERVTVVPSAAYVPPTDPHTIPVDVRVGSGQPRATVSVNGAVGERWILDTGGAGTFLIFDYFARRYPEALRDVGGGDQRDRHLVGIGGAIAAKPYQIASLQLANMNFTDWVGYRVDGRGAYAQNDDGVVGVEFLRLFTVGFDYANGRVYLVPNRDGRIAMGLPQ